MPSLEDADSGLESLTTMESKESSPKKLMEDEDDHDEMDLEETWPERLWGLTEMFPEKLRLHLWSLTAGSWTGIKHLYGFSRSAMWIFFSSTAILMAPVIFEVERAQMDEMQRQQQRQILLGPNAAVAGGMGMAMPAPPNPPSQSR